VCRFCFEVWVRYVGVLGVSFGVKLVRCLEGGVGVNFLVLFLLLCNMVLC